MTPIKKPSGQTWAKLAYEFRERAEKAEADVERLRERLEWQVACTKALMENQEQRAAESRTVAERQREACEGAAYAAMSLHPEPSTRSAFREAVVRAIGATPLVTEGDK